MKSEALVQQETMTELCRLGAIPWRNNVGACTDQNGRVIRYGLANTSKQMNDHVKSSDIIAIWRGRFVAIECKHEGWTLTQGDKRAQAQKRFIDIIIANGGYAGFVSSVADLWRVLGLVSVPNQ